MGIVFRQSIKASIITFGGAVLGALVIFLSLQYIPKQQLGYTRTLSNQAVIVAQILLLGLSSTLSVFIHKYNDTDPKKPALVSMILLLPIFLIGFASIIYFASKTLLINLFQPQDIPFISRYFALLPLYTAFFVYQTILEQYLISQMKVAIAVFLREILLRALNVILIFLFGFGLINFDTFIIATVLIYVIPILFLFLLARRIKSFKWSLNFKLFSRTEYKEMIHFAWYHSLLSISITLIGSLDVLMLAPLDKSGLSSVAIYANAVFIMSLLQIPYRAMMPATFPILTQAYEAKDYAKVKDLFSRSSLNILIATILVAILIGCNIQNAVSLMRKGYEAIVPLTIIMMVGRLADIATGMNDQVLSISNYYKINFYLSLGVVVLMVVFNILFIPSFSIYGAAWSTTLALILYNIAKLVIVKKRLNLMPFSSNTWRVLLAGTPPLLAGIFIPYILNPYIDTIIRSIVILILYVAMLIWLKPSDDMRLYIATVRKNKRLF
ncbi:MAG: polysaccharide biosynthesis C-terminal domain-containing protein [Bacteroidetes bacterium]|nr:polysaccharide biosynthesis C-terminal domain-containing protein [Bacteroidota bacterium]